MIIVHESLRTAIVPITKCLHYNNVVNVNNHVQIRLKNFVCISDSDYKYKNFLHGNIFL